MNYIDYIVMAAFFAVLFLIPAISAMRSKSKGANEYFKSAGSMPWWLIGVSMVAATTSTNSANLFTVSAILIPGIGGMAMAIGEVYLTGIACALILGIVVNIVLNLKKPVSTDDEENK